MGVSLLSLLNVMALVSSLLFPEIVPSGPPHKKTHSVLVNQTRISGLAIPDRAAIQVMLAQQ